MISKFLNQLNGNSFNNTYNLNLTDWNNISAPGIYSGFAAKNSPSNSDEIWVDAIAFASNGNTNFMNVIAIHDMHISVRALGGGIWTDWKLVA